MLHNFTVSHKLLAELMNENNMHQLMIECNTGLLLEILDGKRASVSSIRRTGGDSTKIAWLADEIKYLQKGIEEREAAEAEKFGGRAA